MPDFYEIFFALQDTGFYELVLPFLLVFAITYGVLQKVKLFKDNKINLVISLILGLLVITQFQIVDRLNLFLPKIAFLIVIILMFLFLIGMFQKHEYEGFTGVAYFIAVVASIILIYWALGPSLGFGIDDIIPLSIQGTIWEWLGPLIFLIVVFGMILAPATKQPRTGFDRLMDELGGRRGNP